MTLPPTRIGDQGQPYRVMAENYPKPGWQDIGWTKEKMGAEAIALSILRALTCTATRVILRQGQMQSVLHTYSKRNGP